MTEARRGAGGEWYAGLAPAGAVSAAIVEAAETAEIAVAIATVDDGVPRHVYVNRHAVTLLGYPEDELLGMPVWQVISPTELPRMSEHRRRQARGETRTSKLETVLRRKDGSDVPVELSGCDILLRGQPAMVSFFFDITERKALEAQLILADRSAAAGRLAAGVAHEINNPLTYALLNVEALLSRLPKLAREGPLCDQGAVLDGLLDQLRDVQHGLGRVATIVRDLHAFSGQDEGRHGAVDLRAVLLRAVQVAGSQFRHHAELVEDYDEVPRVDGNAAHLEQVFVNLLTNAAQALEDNRPKKLQVRLRVEAEAVVAEVEDSGAGMAPEVLDRIFDPFFTTKAPGRGTGLGLAITRKLVTDLGGEICVRSVVGEGTVFRVRLRVYRGDPLPVPLEEVRPVEDTGARLRVLVVDDEPMVAGTLSTYLELEHDVTTAEGGRQVMKLLEGGAVFDVILCDLIMPGMTGSELYRVLEERYPAVAARVIFTTGGAANPDVAAFLGETTRPILEKPFDLTRLSRTVREIGERP